MTFIVRLPAMDNLLLGPFETYEKANEWRERSIFADQPYEIDTVITPRQDHRANVPRFRRAA